MGLGSGLGSCKIVVRFGGVILVRFMLRLGLLLHLVLGIWLGFGLGLG